MKHLALFLLLLGGSQIHAQVTEEVWVDSHSLFSGTPDSAKVSEFEQQSQQKDLEFLNKSASQKVDYKSIRPEDRKKMQKKIDEDLMMLLKEKEKLESENANPEAIESKKRVIIVLEKDKEIATLSEESIRLKEEAELLAEEKAKMKRYFMSSGAVFLILILVFFVYMQKKKIKKQDKELEAQYRDIAKKNSYLEQAAVLIRHDMHSGINTYMPRGINSLERQLDKDTIKTLKLGPPLKLIKEGLSQTQKVYKKVYEFTNLVKRNQVLEKTSNDLKLLLEEFLRSTGYTTEVEVSDLGTEDVNPLLFLFALDNLIKNGLKYNESEIKKVKIYRENSDIIVEDNGIGMDTKKFEEVLKAYRTQDSDTGIGINISSAILEEHGFLLSVENVEQGTKIKIKTK
jgi:signal transduction histidine kinase